MQSPDPRMRTGLTVPLAALGLVLIQFLVRLQIVPGSFWWQDDFLHLDAARRSGLTWSYVVRDYNDHLQILPDIAYWGLAQTQTTSWAPAAALLLILQLIPALLMVILLFELVGSRPVVLPLLAIYLFSPLMLVSATWLAFGLVDLALHIALISTTFAMIRFIRTGQRRWWLLSLFTHAFGLLSYEKAALILPLTLTVQVLLVGVGLPWRARLRAISSHRAAWLVHVAMVAGFLALYFSVTDGSERQPVAQANYLRAISEITFRVTIPGLLGAPWSSRNADNTLYPYPGDAITYLLAIVVTVALVLVVRRNGRAAVGPLALLLGYFGADVALMLWGRGGFLVLVARDPRYISDAVPVIVMCLAALAATEALPTGGRMLVRRNVAIEPRSLSPTLGVVGMLMASCLLTTFQVVPVVSHTFARNYVTGMLSGLDTATGSIVDTPLPRSISGKGDHALLLSAFDRKAAFDAPSTEVLMFDGIAQLRPAVPTDAVLAERGPGKACGWLVRSERRQLARIPSDDEGASLIQIGYVAGEAGRLTLEVEGRSQSLALDPGVGYAYFVVRDGEGAAIVAHYDTDDGTPVCLSDLVYGSPQPVP